MNGPNWEYVNECVRKGVEELPQKACGSLWGTEVSDAKEMELIGCFWGAALVGHFGSLRAAWEHWQSQDQDHWSVRIGRIFGISLPLVRLAAEANDYTPLSREEIGFGLKTGQLSEEKVEELRYQEHWSLRQGPVFDPPPDGA